MEDLTNLATSLVGIFVPLITQAIREHWLPWSGKAAMALSFAVSVICVAAAYLQVDPTPTLPEAANSVGVAFTLSQLIYRSIQEKLKGPED